MTLVRAVPFATVRRSLEPVLMMIIIRRRTLHMSTWNRGNLVPSAIRLSSVNARTGVSLNARTANSCT